MRLDSVALVLGGIGLFGLGASLGLLNVLALVYPRPKSRGGLGEGDAALRSLDLLIPAHDEEATIAKTVRELREQARRTERFHPGIRIGVTVGADACSDATSARAREAGAEVEEFLDHRSKWKTIRALISASSADWVGLVDAESVWPPALLEEVCATIAQGGGSVLGVNPTFGTGPAWALERGLKGFENRWGGPVSVHGATVFYERRALLEALAFLDERAPGELWLNDDIVIPLALRTLQPWRRLVYLVPLSGEAVTELPRASIEPSAEAFATDALRRRVRMASGNVQWMRGVLPAVFGRSPLVGWLSLRRVFRLFWAYWAVFLGLAAIAWMAPRLPSTTGAAVGVALGFFVAPMKRMVSIRAAFRASLAAPILWLRPGSARWS